jgi:hypothetical protein
LLTVDKNEPGVKRGELGRAQMREIPRQFETFPLSATMTLIEHVKDYYVRAALLGEEAPFSAISSLTCLCKSGRHRCHSPLATGLMKCNNWICSSHKEVTRLTTHVDREYKSGFFSKIFRKKDPLLELLYAITGTEYPPETDIRINTLKNVMSRGFFE